MRAIDTNVLLRVLTGIDPKHAAIGEDFIAQGAWVSHLVLAETCWVLKSNLGEPPERIAGTIERVLGHEHFVLQEPDVVAAALDSFRERPTAGFSDCLILAIARKNGHAPLGTFDRTLAKLEGTRLL